MKPKVLLHFFTQLTALSGYAIGSPSVEEGKEEIRIKRTMAGTHGKNWWETSTKTQCFPTFFKVVEAMEIMLIAVVSPVIRCEWQLENWQVALVTTVSACFPCFEWTNWKPRAPAPLSPSHRAKSQRWPRSLGGCFQSSWALKAETTICSLSLIYLFSCREHDLELLIF